MARVTVKVNRMHNFKTRKEVTEKKIQIDIKTNFHCSEERRRSGIGGEGPEE